MNILQPVTNGYNGNVEMQNGTYWSSTELNIFGAVQSNFSNGHAGAGTLLSDKINSYSCRCVSR